MRILSLLLASSFLLSPAMAKDYQVKIINKIDHAENKVSVSHGTKIKVWDYYGFGNMLMEERTQYVNYEASKMNSCLLAMGRFLKIIPSNVYQNITSSATLHLTDEIFEKTGELLITGRIPSKKVTQKDKNGKSIFHDTATVQIVPCKGKSNQTRLEGIVVIPKESFKWEGADLPSYCVEKGVKATVIFK